MEPPTVRRTLDLACPAAELWRLVTAPEELSSWLGEDVALELHPGGQGRLVDEDGTTRHLAVREVVDGERLAFTWWPSDDAAAASEVTLTIEPTDEGTRLVVTEAVRWPTVDTVASAAASTASSWDIRLISLWLAVCAQARV
jgi:uncharacterized protein YndB with AHSA1/START domain